MLTNPTTSSPRDLFCIYLEVIFKDKSPLSHALGNNLDGYIHCNSET